MTVLGNIKTFENFKNKQFLCRPVVLNTLLGSQVISTEVIPDVSSECNATNETMSIKLIKFNNKPFECIIGANILFPLGVSVDFSIKAIVVKNRVLPFVNKLNEDNELTTSKQNCLENNQINFDLIPMDHLNFEEKQLLINFLKRKKSAFYQEGQYLTATPCVKHKIVTKPHNPIYTKNYKIPYALQDEVHRQIDSMLENGIIRPSTSPYNSPILLVPKKANNTGEKEWRLVVDFRKLNSITVDDKFPMPNIESLFEKLGRSIYFSTIDLAKGFHQIFMNEADIEKTGFSDDRAHWEYVRMTFGLKNAPATFQRLMNSVLHEFMNKICILYMDDVLIFSTSLTEHMENLNKIFDALLKHNLKVQLNKCKFLAEHTTFLGHEVTSEGIQPSLVKIQAIKNVEVPKTIKEVKAFLGLTGYYRKFIKNYSFIAAPIIKYLKQGAKINVNDASYINAFDKLKQIITSPPILVFPDLSKKFVVTTDASDFAIGAVLSQDNKPVCYASRALNVHEKLYYTLEKELLAIVWALKYFRPYLFGRPFKIQTDHQPLKYLFSLKEPSLRILRWKALITEFEFEIDYIKGQDNKVADFLSRLDTNKAENENEQYDIQSLFQNSIDTVHSAAEDLNNHFLLADSIVNRYLCQIRIVKEKSKEFEKLYNKYKIIYVEEADLTRNTYLIDLFRQHVKRGKIGVHCELAELIKYIM